MSAVVAVLTAIAVLTCAGPPPRRPGPAVQGTARSGPWSAVRGLGRGRAPDPAPGAPPADLAGILHAVVAQLRAGVPPPLAWSRVLGTRTDAPVEQSTLAAVLSVRAVGRAGPDAALEGRVRAVVAGVRVAADTGAPLADVLEDLAGAVAADAEQTGELAAALAGPRATARVLVLLPVLGLLVGAAMGARPWEVLADGGIGTGLGVAGTALVLCGRWWVGALLRRAAAP